MNDKFKKVEDVRIEDGDNKPEELFSSIRDLIPEETCKLLNKMCRE